MKRLAIVSKSKNLYSIKQLIHLSKEVFDTVDQYSYRDVAISLEANEARITLKDTPINYYSHLLTRISDNYYFTRNRMCTYALNMGVKVFNGQLIKSYQTYNKFVLLQDLKMQSLPVVPTLYVQKIQSHNMADTFPLILKPNKGRLAKKVVKVENATDLISQFRKIKNPLIQPFISSSFDVRILICGNEVIGAYKRIATESFITTKNGLQEPYVLTNVEKDLALRTAKVLKADYIGIDIMHIDGEPHILEVNFDAGFKAFDRVLGTNVAKNIIQTLLSL